MSSINVGNEEMHCASATTFRHFLSAGRPQLSQERSECSPLDVLANHHKMQSTSPTPQAGQPLESSLLVHLSPHLCSALSSVSRLLTWRFWDKVVTVSTTVLCPRTPQLSNKAKQPKRWSTPRIYLPHFCHPKVRGGTGGGVR